MEHQPERRKDYINLPVYAERWDGFMKMTEEYRQCLNAKIEKITNSIILLKDSLTSLDKNINEKILRLPCEARKSLFQSLSRQVSFLWVIVSVYIIALFGLIIKVFAQ